MKSHELDQAFNRPDPVGSRKSQKGTQRRRTFTELAEQALQICEALSDFHPIDRDTILQTCFTANVTEADPTISADCITRDRRLRR